MNEPIYRLRSTGQYTKLVLLLFFFLFIVVSLYLDPYSEGFFPPLVFALGGILVAYVFFYQPHVLLTRDGITAANWFFDRSVSWKDYDQLDMRYGMYIMSEGGHSDAVSSYPGTGGIAKGREQLSPSSPLAKTQKQEKYIRIHESGQYNHTASQKEASSLINRMAKEFARDATYAPRTKTIQPIRVAILLIGASLIALGLTGTVNG